MPQNGIKSVFRQCYFSLLCGSGQPPERLCSKKMLPSNASQTSKCCPQTPARLQNVALKLQPGFIYGT